MLAHNNLVFFLKLNQDQEEKAYAVETELVPKHGCLSEL